MTHRPCAMHLAAGETVTGRAAPLFDPLTGRRIPIDLCQQHRLIVVSTVTGYRNLLAEFTPDVDPELVCRCGFPAQTRQGLSRHEAAEHPDPAGLRCPDCGDPTTNLKTHRWREHPIGDDAELQELAGRRLPVAQCEFCPAGPFDGTVAYTGHLARAHPGEGPRCPLGCGTLTLTPHRHLRSKHGIGALRGWTAAGRPAGERPTGLIAESGRPVEPKDLQPA